MLLGFSCKFYEVFESTYFEEHLQTAASKQNNMKHHKTAKYDFSF